ncbi:olfactory receptor 13F1-like, partial [Microcaecilia unicolor]|uniref:Olfactory receptor 13F1-like n=1 Tax=Microcaecilia unicolor TaxID=1415580 RepID=A0A6P7WKR0_9AMPH
MGKRKGKLGTPCSTGQANPPAARQTTLEQSGLVVQRIQAGASSGPTEIVDLSAERVTLSPPLRITPLRPGGILLATENQPMVVSGSVTPAVGSGDPIATSSPIGTPLQAGLKLKASQPVLNRDETSVGNREIVKPAVITMDSIWEVIQGLNATLLQVAGSLEKLSQAQFEISGKVTEQTSRVDSIETEITNMETVKKENKTSATGFVILGFSNQSHLHVFIYVISLPAYVISMLGNVGFLILMFSDHHLHKPMYFFLSNLSFVDIWSTTVTVSTMLQSLFKGKTFISFSLCMTQLYLFLIAVSTEFWLLTAMAYDRFAAICKPLHYPLLMNKRNCVLLAASSWITGFVDMISVVDFISHYSFCGSNEINHFYCDPNALVKLSCSDTHNFEILLLAEGVFVAITPFLFTLSSYAFIISNILKITSSEGRRKAFSTCSSHLTVVVLFYGTIICIYMRPSSMFSPDQDKMFALLYTVFIPMLNPLIYSMRNKEVKNALKNFIFKNHFQTSYIII